MMTKETQLAVMLPEELKIEFQIWCVRHKTTMKTMTIKLVERFLEKEKEKKKE